MLILILSIYVIITSVVQIIINIASAVIPSTASTSMTPIAIQIIINIGISGMNSTYNMISIIMLILYKHEQYNSI